MKAILRLLLLDRFKENLEGPTDELLDQPSKLPTRKQAGAFWAWIGSLVVAGLASQYLDLNIDPELAGLIGGGAIGAITWAGGYVTKALRGEGN